MNKIELIGRIIKIPAGKQILVAHDDNPEEYIVKIPRQLLTTNIKNSEVSLLARVGEQIIDETLEVLFEEEKYINYKWIIDSKYTGGKELVVQFRIRRKSSDDEPIITPGQPDDGEGSEAPIDLLPPEEIEGPTGSTDEEEGPISLLNEVIEEDIDPGMMLPIGNDEPGTFYSYQNKFEIRDVLSPLI